jgi:hypothetical protein
MLYEPMGTAERGSISACVDHDDHERLVELARAEERSVSAELRLAIREHLGSGAAVRTAGVACDDARRLGSRGTP